MKNILSVLIGLFVLISCSTQQDRNKQSANLDANAITDSLIVAVQSDPEMDSQIKDFETMYKGIVNELYDSVRQHQTDGIDFSDITNGIERKYNGCSNETEKVLIGYQLAKNYLLHYRNSDKESYHQKADSMFNLFLCYKDGNVASRYLKLDTTKVHFIVKGWDNFTEQEKDSIMFYGLLRGFDSGLPYVLKSIE